LHLRRLRRRLWGVTVLDLAQALDYEHPPVIPPEWWASPLGVAISRALARDDDLSLLRLMGSRAAGVEEVVARARERGASWAQIGSALGIRTQSAWERFAGR